MVRIISKAISLANAPMLTGSELLVRARDWSEALWGIVPAEALSQSVSRAFENHQSSFPLNAYEVKLAYTELQSQAAIVAESRTLSTDEMVEKCTNKDNHVEGHFGMIELYLPDGNIAALVPCGRCRAEEYKGARERLFVKVAA